MNLRAALQNPPPWPIGQVASLVRLIITDLWFLLGVVRVIVCRMFLVVLRLDLLIALSVVSTTVLS